MTVMCDNCTQAYVRRNQISTGDPGKRRLETDVIMYHQYSTVVSVVYWYAAYVWLRKPEGEDSVLDLNANAD